VFNICALYLSSSMFALYATVVVSGEYHTRMSIRVWRSSFAGEP
jgi:hypothetical protein